MSLAFDTPGWSDPRRSDREVTTPSWVLMSARKDKYDWLVLCDVEGQAASHSPHAPIPREPFVNQPERYGIYYTAGFRTCAICGADTMPWPPDGQWFGDDEAEARRMFREIESRWIDD